MKGTCRLNCLQRLNEFFFSIKKSAFKFMFSMESPHSFISQWLKPTCVQFVVRNVLRTVYFVRLVSCNS